MGSIMLNERDLLNGIVEHPLELDRWLILSDWLEDQGDTRCELARLRYQLHTETSLHKRQQLRVRQQELLATGLAPLVPQRADNALNLPLGLVLPGTFWMGSHQGYQHDARPHQVTLTRPFFLGLYPVTMGEFETFVQAAHYTTEAEWARDAITWRKPQFPQHRRHPVVGVSWLDAQAMVHWLNEQTPDPSLLYRLPTEAEWEYACRAGSTTEYFWGDDAGSLGEYAWYADNSESRTHPVETKRPNPWGFFHMPGNVWEWCADVYGIFPGEPVTDPTGPPAGNMSRVLRGGSWNNVPRRCRSATRDHVPPQHRCNYYGFRLAVSCIRE